ncbi:hypothetical protein [Chromobacterium sp. ASV23]|uniref:hypothetical protein n=1 Tax=Chromobacterium sp. ASV23 TaxID=2795110 RepID=UPI0018EB3E61|nr:hypothetical protein [Chromobacterium sp. ASV23]
MERWKQAAKIFDNLGLAALAAAITVILRDMTGLTGKFQLKMPTGDSGALLFEAILFYAGFQVVAILILGFVDESKRGA